MDRAEKPSYPKGLQERQSKRKNVEVLSVRHSYTGFESINERIFCFVFRLRLVRSSPTGASMTTLKPSMDRELPKKSEEILVHVTGYRRIIMLRTSLIHPNEDNDRWFLGINYIKNLR